MAAMSFAHEFEIGLDLILDGISPQRAFLRAAFSVHPAVASYNSSATPTAISHADQAT